MNHCEFYHNNAICVHLGTRHGLLWVRSFDWPSLVVVAGSSLTTAYRDATAAEAVPSPLKVDTKFPQLSQVVMSAQMFSPELVAYVENSKTVCTLIAPNNEVGT